MIYKAAPLIYLVYGKGKKKELESVYTFHKKNNILPFGPHRTVLLHAFDGVPGFSPRFKVFPEKENYCTTFLPNFHELEINVFNCWL